MFKIFGEKTPVQTPVQKYEKEATENAKKHGIKKEDVVRIDADMENEARKEVKRGGSIFAEADGGVYALTKEYLDAFADTVKDSTLHFDGGSIIKGIIKGHEIKIIVGIRNAECEIDGKRLSDKDAMTVYNKYKFVAEERDKRLRREEYKQSNSYRKKNTESEVKDIL